MRKYLQNYGWHFNKALCSYAISFMKKEGNPQSQYPKNTLIRY